MQKHFPIIIILVSITFFIYGVSVGNYEIFPYDLLKEIKILSNISNENYQRTIPQFDINSLVKIENSDDIINKRNTLINLIWNTDSLPSSYDQLEIQTNYHDNRYDDLSNLSHIDKFITIMEYDVNSISYLFHSSSKNNNLVIYHQGHDGDFLKGKDTIEKLLSNGYDVLAFSMPLYGLNNNPEVTLENIGVLKLAHHNQFHYLDNEKFSSLVYFLEPILISLNYIESHYDYDSFSFVGISGGGWTAILYSAIDERILQTYSVAGTYPIFLRTESQDYGDYEQTLPKLYSSVNYLELYILGSYGENRKLIQIFNEFDPCCFDGESYTLYEPIISKKIDNLNSGDFEIILDSTHNEHKISNFAINEILKSIN